MGEEAAILGGASREDLFEEKSLSKNMYLREPAMEICNEEHSILRKQSVN